MRARGGGVIVNIASTAGVRPRPGLTWYNGSKGAAITLTKSMAAELAADRIRVCAINPVIGETRSEEHTSELQSLMRISYAVFCLKKKKSNKRLKQHL